MSDRSPQKENNPQIDYARQLQLYQQKINNILESFTDAYFEVDSEWTVTYWNKEAERLMGILRADIVGKNLWSVYEEAISLKFYPEYHRAVKENVSVRFEEYFAPLNLWIEVAAFPSGDSLSVYFKDITARKLASEALETEKQKYEDLFNLSPLPQWVYDLETLAFLDVNEAAVAQYQYSKDEFLNMTIRDIRPPEEQAVLDKIMKESILTGGFNQSSVKHQKKNGERIHVLVQGNTVSFEGRNARLVLAIDMTERIRNVQAIAAQNRRLLEISWLQSHKVRAPLARILGLVGLMDTQDPVNTSDVRELIGLIRDSAHDLDHVIKEISNKSII